MIAARHAPCDLDRTRHHIVEQHLGQSIGVGQKIVQLRLTGEEESVLRDPPFAEVAGARHLHLDAISIGGRNLERHAPGLVVVPDRELARRADRFASGLELDRAHADLIDGGGGVGEAARQASQRDLDRECGFAGRAE